MKRADDRQLVQAVLEGNRAAFGLLADRHSERARQVAQRMVGNYDIACELVQEALLQAYLGISTLRDPTHFAVWLVGIVQNVCRTHRRSQRRLHLVDGWPDDAELFVDDTVDPVTELERRERQALVQQAIAGLSPKNQMAIWLYYMEAMSIEEVAQTLDVSPNAIKGRLYQARKQLYAVLAPDFATPRLRITTTQPTAQEREKTMAKISAVKILGSAPSTNSIMYLFATEQQRYLRIWIGSHEGEQIRLQLESIATARPMTYRYFADFLHAMEIQLESVTVARLHESTFYATSTYRNGTVIKELDGRPSDAIGMALHTGSPIFVDDELLANNSEVLPDDIELEQWFVNEIERIRQEQLAAAGLTIELLKGESEHFSAHARIALLGATGLAYFLRNNYVGTEHLLWGLIHDNSGPAAQLLHTAGVTTVTLNQVAVARLGALPKTIEVEEIKAESDDPTAPTPQFVPRVMQVLELAKAAKEEMNAPKVGTEHLLLGILREGGGMAVTLLQDLEVDPAALEEQLLTVVSGEQQ